MKDYVSVAARYCEDVLSGAVPACQWVRLACKRQQRDLARQADAAWPFRFDEAKANRVCAFVERLPHVKGPLTGQLIKLEPWQIFVLTTIFGWLVKATGFRRYRRVYIEVPRGNAKSTLSSAVALYMLAADGEGGAEVYSAARTKEQAGIVFNDAKKMLRHEAAAKLREKFGLTALEHSIIQQKTNSIFKALASENGALDGLATHFCVLDELHAHPTRDVHDVMLTSTGKRPQSLFWSITTAGSNLAGICCEVRDSVTKFLEGTLTDETYFGIIYTIDEGDDWTQPESWAKANPNFGISVFPDDIEAKARMAIARASAQHAFKTKHLCVWCQTDTAWMDMRRFLACADAQLKESEFAGEACVLGIDLASKLDLLAYLRVYPRKIEGRLHLYCFGTYWTPEARIESSPNAQYRGWAASGTLQSCEGETNDYGVVLDAIRNTARGSRVLEVCIDPYQAVSISNELLREGLRVVEVQQMPKYLSPAMKELEAAVYDGRFHYSGDPVLAWGISNVVCHEDKNGNFFPNKARAENKIDPATALLTALSRVLALDATGHLNSGAREYLTVI